MLLLKTINKTNSFYEILSENTQQQNNKLHRLLSVLAIDNIFFFYFTIFFLYRAFSMSACPIQIIPWDMFTINKV
jgi:hypothetical protein